MRHNQSDRGMAGEDNPGSARKPFNNRDSKPKSSSEIEDRECHSRARERVRKSLSRCPWKGVRGSENGTRQPPLSLPGLNKHNNTVWHNRSLQKSKKAMLLTTKKCTEYYEKGPCLSHQNVMLPFCYSSVSSFPINF